jgi:Fe2+ or Zn2+ uptake regulation protein
MTKNKAPREMSHIEKTLREAGLKVTPQRAAILEYLLSNYTHPSAENILNEVRKTYPSVSRNTVYQTLDFFEGKRLVFAIMDTVGVRRYDAHTEPHIHLICLDCGAIVDAPYDDRRILGKVKKLFKPEKSAVYIYGRCVSENPSGCVPRKE